MVENKCSKCGVDVDHTVPIRTKKKGDYYNFFGPEMQYWCFDCLRAKILWPASPRDMTGNPSGKVPFVPIGSLDTDQQRTQGKRK